MTMFIGNYSKCREITPPRQFEVLTGRSHLKCLENGDVRTFKERSIFTIDDATGSFSAQTEYGDFAYRWTAIGNRTLSQFLCGLDKHYFMNKAAKQPWREVDLSDTLVEFKREVIEARKCRSIDKDHAREMWDEIEGFDDQEFRNSDGVYRWFYDLSELPKVIEPYDLPISYRDTALSNHFWDVIWTTFVAHLHQIEETERSKIEFAA